MRGQLKPGDQMPAERELAQRFVVSRTAVRRQVDAERHGAGFGIGPAVRCPFATTAVSNEFPTAARGMGWSKYDFACVFDVLVAMSGVQTPVNAAPTA